MPNLPNEPLADLLEALYNDAKALYMRDFEPIGGPMKNLLAKIYNLVTTVRYGLDISPVYPISDDEYLP